MITANTPPEPLSDTFDRWIAVLEQMRATERAVRTAIAKLDEQVAAIDARETALIALRDEAKAAVADLTAEADRQVALWRGVADDKAGRVLAAIKEPG